MTFYSRQTIGKIIAAHRIERELSQEQLAIQVRHYFPGVKCSQFMVSMVENGQQETSLSQLGAIAAVLGLPISVFVKAEDQRICGTSLRTYTAPGRYNLE